MIFRNISEPTLTSGHDSHNISDRLQTTKYTQMCRRPRISFDDVNDHPFSRSIQIFSLLFYIFSPRQKKAL